MGAFAQLRPDLASVRRFLALKRATRTARTVQPDGGILTELVSGQGLQ